VGTTRLCIVLFLAVVCAMAIFGAQSAHAQTYKVLYSFKGVPDGREPYAGVVQDPAGNLYGTTLEGGSSGYGTVFKLSGTGKETVLHSFTGSPDGSGPYAGVVQDPAGNLYGTTFNGGNFSCGQGLGCGTVFKVSKSGKQIVLHTFTGGRDGANPTGGLILDANGNLYGTSTYGGDLSCVEQEQRAGCGTVFKLSKSGEETVLYAFTGGSDGANPTGGLILDANGNLYGTTSYGGHLSYECGTVFKLSKSGKKTVLHRFTGKADGGFPYGGVIMDAKKNLYGTTTYGGSGFGTVFKISPAGNETVLYNFKGGSDGLGPYSGVIQDPQGNLYGTQYQGGSFGGGTVWKLSKTGRKTVLHAFTDGADGGAPYAGVTRDAKGNLYGTAIGNGAFGYGVVFEITP
jgi:uncharacterized repeat protein (TIGR03803 family)